MEVYGRAGSVGCCSGRIERLELTGRVGGAWRDESYRLDRRMAPSRTRCLLLLALGLTAAHFLAITVPFVEARRRAFRERYVRNANDRPIEDRTTVKDRVSKFRQLRRSR